MGLSMGISMGISRGISMGISRGIPWEMKKVDVELLTNMSHVPESMNACL
jgi:hypothetical protein